MLKPDFTFEAMLSYSRKRMKRKEIKNTLEFIKEYTLDINELCVEGTNIYSKKLNIGENYE